MENAGTHAPARVTLRNKSLMRLIPFAVPAAILVLWQIASVRAWVSPLILPSPTATWDTFVSLVLNGDIGGAFVVSLKRIAVGFGIGTVLGLILGVAFGLSKSLNDYIGPTLRALSQVPTIGWVPILILLLGLDETVKYIVIAKASFILIVIATMDGIRNIPRSYVDAMEVLRLSWSTRLLRFWIPAALPSIIVGLRLGLGAAWVALVIVEMLAATEGVGYMMVWGRMLFQLDIVMVGMVLIGVSGLALDQLMAVLEKKSRRGEIVHG